MGGKLGTIFARAAAFAMSQPEDVDVNEILFRPTRHDL
jgi:NADP-dependent 3-hydroxy acid dehydrogenase YdfG